MPRRTPDRPGTGNERSTRAASAVASSRHPSRSEGPRDLDAAGAERHRDRGPAQPAQVPLPLGMRDALHSVHKAGLHAEHIKEGNKAGKDSLEHKGIKASEAPRATESTRPPSPSL